MKWLKALLAVIGLFNALDEDWYNGLGNALFGERIRAFRGKDTRFFW
jgi:hypothetical protein